ncbi:hypothetical protein MNBD_GAMMA21-1310 [hydrothermal vent metagenome]|uniref:Uncharacterized protein n=1 Tax=hydrothermal vent metagenome TaxID=652676 RepID=A0A3B0ZTX3_9ZZZZ
MSHTLWHPVKNYFKVTRLFVLLMFVPLILTACADNDNVLPDYEVKRLRVDAMNTDTNAKADITSHNTEPLWATGWRFEFNVVNKGGEKGLGPNEDGSPHASIPVLFSATIPADRLSGCPSRSTNDISVYDGPGFRQLQVWRFVPVKSGPIYSFSNIFVTNTDPPNNCVLEDVYVHWDARKSDYDNTIVESDYTNNKMFISITSWPGQKTWVNEKKSGSDGSIL